MGWVSVAYTVLSMKISFLNFCFGAIQTLNPKIDPLPLETVRGFHSFRNAKHSWRGLTKRCLSETV